MSEIARLRISTRAGLLERVLIKSDMEESVETRTHTVRLKFLA